MITDEQLNAFRSARRPAQIAALGALFVICAFTLSIWQLFRLTNEVAQQKQKVVETKRELLMLSEERKKLFEENTELKRQKLIIKQNNQKLEEAVKLQQNRDYVASLAKLQAIIQLDPQNEVALYSAAHAAYQLRDYSNAIQFASAALKVDSNYFEPYPPLICALEKTDKREQGLQQLLLVVNRDIGGYASLISRNRYFDEIWSVKEYRTALIRHQGKLKAVQAKLRELGLYNCRECTIDGLVGANTRQAVESFLFSRQLTNQLGVDGLLLALNQAMKMTPTNSPSFSKH